MTRRIDPDGPESFQVRANGIPAVAVVTYYKPPDPGHPGIYDRRTANLIDPGEPPSPEHIEWELHDRKGYPAEWLVNRLTNKDIHHIDQQILDTISTC